MVIDSDYCGDLRPLSKAFKSVSGLVDPERFKRFTDEK